MWTALLCPDVQILELTLQSPIFADTLARCPTAELEVDSQNILEDGTIQMLVWLTGADADTFEAALDDDPTLGEYDCLVVESSRRLYRVRFSATAIDHSVHHQWAELGGTLLDSIGTHEGWDLRMRLPDRSAVESFYRACERAGLTPDIRALYHSLDAGGVPPFGLTEKQHDALTLALAEGYFDVPRETNLTDLAAQLGISRQSLSRRLRRGLHSLLENTLVESV